VELKKAIRIPLKSFEVKVEKIIYLVFLLNNDYLRLNISI
jgi:hypothetical protein